MLNLFRKKLRSALTMVGIIIGALAVVTIVALGNGLSSFIDQQMRSIANPRVMEIWPKKGFSPGRIAQGIFSNLGQAPREIKSDQKDNFIGTMKINMMEQETVDKIKAINGIEEVRNAA